ncbi:hypothetical protein [Bradyrhizobium sp. NBAIM01]|uniref:hypothetical protein n=1 Tax=Bradyrhizobium sp. NBAIM01 TaxID=2793818 RepID=UPI001CD72486|nr:hypothetical protein [Bradyrhizobium sp. NBAIM01]MCA1510458.1 hypothetical protein [Bradyrhizobium sp. NBAIM01]
MNVRRFSIMGVGSALATLVAIGALPAEGDPLIATVGKPAIVTATRSKPQEGLTADKVPSRVVVLVTGFQPAQQGNVRAIVKVQRADGKEQEIGTFGVFPDRAFKAETSRARAFSFPLPKELAVDSVKLKIEVVPDKERGTGEGARLEIGRAEIQ